MKLELQKGSRSRFLAAMIFGIMAVFVVRLFYLQIVQHGYYVELANEEQVKRLTIPAKRGVIYALDGSSPIPLVMNQTVYTVFADPQTVKDDAKIISVIKKVAGGNARSDLQTLLDQKDSRYQILATKISRAQAEMIKKEDLDGIGFQEESQRVYPEGSLASQLLGFVDYSGSGKYGVEEKLNDRLTGTDGLLQSVTDVSNVPLTIGSDYINKAVVDGENIVLSIDRNVQSYVSEALARGLVNTGATKGSVIVMNPQNGRIMAMANLPTYNVTEYDKVTDVSLFNNAVVSEPYEPGSVIKTLTMATGVEKGVVSPTSTYVNTDYIRVEDATIKNFDSGLDGVVTTFQEALNLSHNVGFVTVAKRLGDGDNINRQARDTMYEFFHDKFKLGQITGVEVANEVAGTIISPTESEGGAVRYSNMAFGQGMDITMVQVAAAFSSLANGGKRYTPTIVAGVIDKTGEYVENKISAPTYPVSAATANTLREMTHTTRSYLFGYHDKTGYYTGGKTGTSDVLINGSYSSDESIATYLGYGGSVEESKYVIMLQLSADGKALNGALDAEPIFTDMSNWMLDYLNIQPKA